MSIQMPGLYRQALPQGKALAAQEYRKELANELAKYDARPDELALKFETETVQIGSLQSEGHLKREPSRLKSKGATEQEYFSMQKQLQHDSSTLPRIASGQLDEESKAVLQDVKSAIETNGGCQGEYFLTPVTLVGTDMLVTRAVRLDDQGYVAGGYNVALHDTPGLDDGLMLITPLSNRDLQSSGQNLRADVLFQQTLSLNAIDQGFQFHKF